MNIYLFPLSFSIIFSIDVMFYSLPIMYHVMVYFDEYGHYYNGIVRMGYYAKFKRRNAKSKTTKVKNASQEIETITTNYSHGTKSITFVRESNDIKSIVEEGDYHKRFEFRIDYYFYENGIKYGKEFISDAIDCSMDISAWEDNVEFRFEKNGMGPHVLIETEIIMSEDYKQEECDVILSLLKCAAKSIKLLYKPYRVRSKL